MHDEVETIFSSTWKPIIEVDKIPNKYPGNYLLAWSNKHLAGKLITPQDVEYVGMSNRQDGVKERIKDFYKMYGGPVGS